MNLRVNQDGKLWDRFVASAIPVAIGLVLARIVWWKDATTQTVEPRRRSPALRGVSTRSRPKRARPAARLRKTGRRLPSLLPISRNVARGVGRIEATSTDGTQRHPPSRPQVADRFDASLLKFGRSALQGWAFFLFFPMQPCFLRMSLR